MPGLSRGARTNVASCCATVTWGVIRPIKTLKSRADIGNKIVANVRPMFPIRLKDRQHQGCAMEGIAADTDVFHSASNPRDGGVRRPIPFTLVSNGAGMQAGTAAYVGQNSTGRLPRLAVAQQLPKASNNCQLSKVWATGSQRLRKCISGPFLRAFLPFGLVGWPGLEPGTNGLKGRCSTD